MSDNKFLENPVTTEIIRNLLQSIAKEMNESLFRSAYSPIIYEGEDCAVALLNEKTESLGESLGVPLFLGSLGMSVQITTDYYGSIDFYQEGDIYILNDAYLTGSHLNDVTVFSPIFYKSELVGFSATTAHWLDLGAKDAATATDNSSIYQEGLRMGPLKIMDKGELRKDLVDTICLNSRFPSIARGDLNAQIASCKTGEKRLVQVIERYGLRTFKKATHDIFKQSEIFEKEELAQIPNGVYEADGYLDNDGINDEPVYVKVKVTVKDQKMHIDLTGSSDMVQGSTNCGFTETISAVKMAYKMIIQPDAPVSGGSFKALKITIPKRSIFAAENPAACSWYFSSLGLVIDLTVNALKDAIPNKVAAAHYGDSMMSYLSGIHPKKGKFYIAFEGLVGGWGATRKDDGENCLRNITVGNVKNCPIEVFESLYPMKINRYEIRNDSEGPGYNRGGMGSIREYEPLVNKVRLQTWYERTKCLPWGIEGGKTAKPPKITVTGEDGSIKANNLFKTNNFTIEKGWKLTVCSAGGGGYGDPYKREPGKVLNDYLEEYISREHAQKKYGVVITDSGEIDIEMTDGLRKIKKRIKGSLFL